jgi:hypothetical protein
MLLGKKKLIRGVYKKEVGSQKENLQLFWALTFLIFFLFAYSCSYDIEMYGISWLLFIDSYKKVMVYYFLSIVLWVLKFW